MIDTFPSIAHDENAGTIIRADLVFPDKYEPMSGDYVSADMAVTMLNIRAKQGDKDAINWLSELCGNHYNKLAFNALNELGMMASANTPETKRGFAQFLFDVYKKADREKAELIAFWSYPSFSYKELDMYGKSFYTTSSEAEFVYRIMLDITDAYRNEEKIKIRIRQIQDDFVVDVHIGDQLSTFNFIFSNNTFTGIIREFPDFSIE